MVMARRYQPYGTTIVAALSGAAIKRSAVVCLAT